jgi:hypothetical protein
VLSKVVVGWSRYEQASPRRAGGVNAPRALQPFPAPLAGANGSRREPFHLNRCPRRNHAKQLLARFGALVASSPPRKFSR